MLYPPFTETTGAWLLEAVQFQCQLQEPILGAYGSHETIVSANVHYGISLLLFAFGLFHDWISLDCLAAEVANVVQFGRSVKRTVDSRMIGQYGNGLKS